MATLEVRRQHDGRPFTLPVHVAGPTDAPIALLLHGFPQRASLWDECLADLHDAGLRTVTVDQRGYGPLPQPTDVSAYRLDALVADALAVLDEVAPDAGPAVLVGHDWGAVVAWALAATHPDRVRGLVAASVPHPRAFAEALRDDPEQQRRSSYMTLLRDVDHAEQVLLAGGARRLRGFFQGSGLDATTVDGYVTPLLEPGRLRGPLSWYAAMDDEQLAAVPPVRVPTVYLSAEQDLAVAPRAVAHCAQYVEGPYRHVALPGTHWIPDERPDVVVEAVRALR